MDRTPVEKIKEINMKRIASIIGIAAIIGLSGTVLPCTAQELQDYKYRETKDLVSLVRDAATAIATKGEYHTGAVFDHNRGLFTVHRIVHIPAEFSLRCEQEFLCFSGFFC